MSFPVPLHLRLVPTRATLGLLPSVFVVISLASATSGQAAPASLESDGGDVVERSHRRNVTIAPYWAMVRDQHTFALSQRPARSAKAKARARYAFELPAGAIVTGLSVKQAGVEHRASSIDSVAAVTVVPSAVEAAPDLAVLRAINGTQGGPIQYQLVLYPITAASELRATISWAMPTRFENSAVLATIPKRTSSVGLAPSVVRLSSQGSDGVSLRTLAVNGGAAQGTFDGKNDLAVSANAVIGGANLSLAAHAFPFGKSLKALTVRLAIPQRSSSALAKFAELVVVVDASRSVGRDGQRASAAFVAALLSSLPEDT